MAKQIFVSKEGLLKLQNELEFLKTEKRSEVAQAIKKARSFGDLSENSEYDEAKNEQAEIESKIAQLDEIIKNATVLDDKHLKTDKVSIGNIVKVYDVHNDNEAEYYIVGSTEADPFANKISDDSPMGKALLGCREGDTVSVDAPVGILKYNIISIKK